METNHLTNSSLLSNKTRAETPTAAPKAGASVDGARDAEAPAATDKLTESVLARQQAEEATDQVESKKLIQDTLVKLNNLAQTSIAFSEHEETGRTVITVSDKKTGEEIRTIPSEDLLEIAAHLKETLDDAEVIKPGLLVSSHA